MSDTPRCELCGEPMPPGEEMFKFHGYSGPCPKPPLRVHNVVNMGEIVNCAGGRHVWTGDIAEGDTCDCGAWYRFNDRIEQSHA